MLRIATVLSKNRRSRWGPGVVRPGRSAARLLRMGCGGWVGSAGRVGVVGGPIPLLLGEGGRRPGEGRRATGRQGLPERWSRRAGTALEGTDSVPSATRWPRPSRWRWRQAPAVDATEGEPAAT